MRLSDATELGHACHSFHTETHALLEGSDPKISWLQIGSWPTTCLYEYDKSAEALFQHHPLFKMDFQKTSDRHLPASVDKVHPWHRQLD